MLDRTHHIVRAALTVFSRYGVAKTTMNDIAAEAGVARQTVYNAFPGKTEILRAAVRLAMDEALVEMQDAWEAADGLGTRVDIYFQTGPIARFEAVQARPELAELLDGANAVASEEVVEAKAKWVAFMAGSFERAGYRCHDPEVSMRDVAEFLYTTGKNAKYDAKSKPDLLARLKVAKLAVLALLAAD